MDVSQLRRMPKQRTKLPCNGLAVRICPQVSCLDSRLVRSPVHREMCSVRHRAVLGREATENETGWEAVEAWRLKGDAAAERKQEAH